MMFTDDKISARALAASMQTSGVKHAVFCPGSRNAPLIIAISELPAIQCHSVVDERVAAFIALGLIRATGSPAAVVCTSGTAIYDASPAVAEAYYSELPLVLVSADRPAHQIDRDLCQTLHQPEALQAITKAQIDIPLGAGSDFGRECYSRCCEIIRQAMALPPGPVHINAQFEKPLLSLPHDIDFSAIDSRENLKPKLEVSPKLSLEISQHISQYNRVLIIAGSGSKNSKRDRALAQFLDRPGSKNIALCCEPQSNIDTSVVGQASTLLPAASLSISPDEWQQFAPQLLITIGTSTLCQEIRNLLATSPNMEHWVVGPRPFSPDTYGRMTRHIEIAPEFLFPTLNPCCASNYRQSLYEFLAEKHAKFVKYAEQSPWSDLKACKILFDKLPADYNLSLSNGMAARYGALLKTSPTVLCTCNRGVSGIDGSTSVAIGHAMAGDSPVLLLTGDMSMQYDIGALATTPMPRNLRIAVLANGDGSIFHRVFSPDHAREAFDYISPKVNLPLHQLAEAYSFNFYKARSSSSLREVLDAFLAHSDRPAILEITTDSDISAQVLKQFK